MNAFIAMENYIKKEEKDFGVGVPITLDEDVAKFESTRRKNVQTYNQWLSISIPGEDFFINVSKPVKEQSDDILQSLMKREFLTTLFVTETKRLANNMDNLVKTITSNEEKLSKSNEIFSDFLQEKYETLLNLQSGQELFDFVNKKCRTHNGAISSALLYSSGIKGFIYHDVTGERFLLYNAKNDIRLNMANSEVLNDSKLIL